jgi:hypothetical protein
MRKNWRMLSLEQVMSDALKSVIDRLMVSVERQIATELLALVANRGNLNMPVTT